MAQLRIHARSGNYRDQPQAIRLMQYCVGRGAQLRPVDENFARACDQIDRADAMLAKLRERARQGTVRAELVSPEAGTVILARRDPQSQTVTLVLDTATADAAMFAVAAHADEREAHVREVQRHGDKMPQDSYGRANRQVIAARETRVATRLRAVEQAYRRAIEPDTAFRPPEHAADKEIELE